LLPITRWQGDLARKRVAVAAYYFVPGVVFASWASRIPDVKQMLHLSNGQLGTVLFAIPIGQLLMMAFSGVLVSKFGSRKMILLAEVLYAFVLFCMGSSSTVFQLILSLMAFGMMANLMNIATNTQACLVEKMYGRNIMSSFHGLWSLGGFSGGIIGAVFANTLLPIEVHFGAVLVMSLLIIAFGFRYLVDDATAKAEEEDVPKFSFKTIDPILFLLGLMGFAGMFCEGTVYDWFDIGRFVAGCCLSLSDSCHFGLPAGRFRHLFIGAYLLQHRRKAGNHQGEHRHHHRFEHQLLRFPGRTTGYRMAC
jgi:MFS family permease